MCSVCLGEVCICVRLSWYRTCVCVRAVCECEVCRPGQGCRPPWQVHTAAHEAVSGVCPPFSRHPIRVLPGARYLLFPLVLQKYDFHPNSHTRVLSPGTQTEDRASNSPQCQDGLVKGTTMEALVLKPCWRRHGDKAVATY
jgi:hypothetical protein